MSCETCNDAAGSTAAPKRAFDTVFEQFWPHRLPYPMMTPWMGAVVTRSQARAWAIAVGAEADAGVMAGDPQAMLDFVGRVMLGGGVYAGERKKKKKENDESAEETPTCQGTIVYGTYETALAWVRENCGGYGWITAINTLVVPNEWCVGCGETPPTGDAGSPGEIVGDL